MWFDNLSPTEKRTFALDSGRQAIAGVLNTLTTSVVLVVAIKVFAVGDGLKGTISAASSIGMMISLFYAAGFSGSGVRRSVLASVPLFGSAVLMGLAGTAGSGLIYAILASGAVLTTSLATPFRTAIYRDNYHPSRRGRLFSTGMILSMLVSTLTGWWFGRLLDASLESFRPILIISGVAYLGAAVLVYLIPSERSVGRDEANPLKNLKVVLTDRRFRLVTIGWFLAGFATLWTAPVRIVYLAEPGRGLDLSPMTILIITAVIPGLTRLVATRGWGLLFDRYNFISLRIVMSLLMGVGILVFFLTKSVVIIGLGMVILSVANAGAIIAWNLWVTRAAPEGKTQVYMSVHVFFTGLRGILGPYLGLLFVGRFSYLQMGFVSMGLAVAAVFVLLRLIWTGERI